jgi:hypothetical protein
VTALGPPPDLRLRLLGTEDQVSLPLDPQGVHLERTRQDVQGSQSERIDLLEAKRRLKELLETSFFEVFIARAKGEELFVRVNPEAPGGR